MYNRYLNQVYSGPPSPPSPTCNIHNEPPPNASAGCGQKAEGHTIFTGLNEMLSGRLKNLHFDLDTLIIIIAVYFLLTDCDDFDTDLLILIGILFLFGL